MRHESPSVKIFRWKLGDHCQGRSKQEYRIYLPGSLFASYAQHHSRSWCHFRVHMQLQTQQRFRMSSRVERDPSTTQGDLGLSQVHSQFCQSRVQRDCTATDNQLLSLLPLVLQNLFPFLSFPLQLIAVMCTQKVTFIVNFLEWSVLSVSVISQSSQLSF